MAEGAVGRPNASTRCTAPRSFHDFPCPVDAQPCFFAGFPCSFKLAGDGAVAGHAATGPKQGGQCGDGRRMVGHVQHDSVQTVWCKALRFFDGILCSGIKVRMPGPIRPCAGGLSQIFQTDAGVFLPRFDGDVVA